MKLYEALTDEWLVLHNDQKALSDESLCHFLCHCIEDILPLTEGQQRLAKDLLALDMLTFSASASIPISSAGTKRRAARPTPSSATKPGSANLPGTIISPTGATSRCAIASGLPARP